MCSAGDMSTAAQQPNVAFYPHHHSQQQHSGETGGNGGGGKAPTREEAPERPANTAPPPQSAKDFFSRLDWQAGDSGYTAFAGGSESDSDESSSSSEDEENQEMFGHAPFVETQTNHTPLVSVLYVLCSNFLLIRS